MKKKFLSAVVLVGTLLSGLFFAGCQVPVISVDTNEFKSSQSLDEYKGLGFEMRAFSGDKQTRLAVVKANDLVKGFGVTNSTPSNELGANSSILVVFDYPVSDANLTFSWLGGSEMAKVELIAKDGVSILKSLTFKNGSDGADTYTNITLKKSPNFKYMRFSSLGNGSDFLINQIKATVSTKPSSSSFEFEGNEIVKLNPDKPKPVKPKPVKPSGIDKNLLLKLVNDARARGANCGGDWYEPVGALKWNDELELAAKRHSEDMNRHKHFSHTGTDGSVLADRVNGTKYDWSALGENIAAGQRNERDVINSWLHSPGHCKNIMNGNFKDMGIYKSGKYWTQNLGRGWD